MKTTFVKTGSLARLSGDIDDLFDQLENALPVQPSGNEFLHCHECSNPACCSSCPSNLDLAAAPVNQDVPTSQGSSRPNADKLHYRHQSVIDSVFDIPFITSNPPFIVSVFDTELPMSDGYIGDVFYSSGDRISLTVVSDIADAFHFSDGSLRDSCIASLTAFGFFCQWSELEQSK